MNYTQFLSKINIGSYLLCYLLVKFVSVSSNFVINKKCRCYIHEVLLLSITNKKMRKEAKLSAVIRYHITRKRKIIRRLIQQCERSRIKNSPFSCLCMCEYACMFSVSKLNRVKLERSNPWLSSDTHVYSST